MITGFVLLGIINTGEVVRFLLPLLLVPTTFCVAFNALLYKKVRFSNLKACLVSAFGIQVFLLICLSLLQMDISILLSLAALLNAGPYISSIIIYIVRLRAKPVQA